MGKLKRIYIAMASEIKKRRILYVALFSVIILVIALSSAGYLKTTMISYAPTSIWVSGDSVVETEESIPSVTEEENLRDGSASNDKTASSSTSSKKSTTSVTPATSPSPSNTPSSIPPSSPESPSAYVAFYADTQSDSDGDDQNHNAVVNLLLNSGANPIIHAGDLMEDGTQESLNRFNNVTATLRSTRTFYSALGNNDRKYGDATLPSPLYLANFNYPNNEQWYSVNIGNLHMVVLDSAFSSASQTQLNWLASDLAATPSSKITGVIYHHPTFSSTVHNIFRDNRVDFVITGHYHSYSQVTSDGIHYYVLSGQPAIGYATAQVFSNSATINVYNSSNSLIDTASVNNR